MSRSRWRDHLWNQHQWQLATHPGPGDLPVKVSTRPELIVDLKTAREIGVTIPAEVLKRADQVIQQDTLSRPKIHLWFAFAADDWSGGNRVTLTARRSFINPVGKRSVRRFRLLPGPPPSCLIKSENFHRHQS
jgi:hypothetical protein